MQKWNTCDKSESRSIVSLRRSVVVDEAVLVSGDGDDRGGVGTVQWQGTSSWVLPMENEGLERRGNKGMGDCIGCSSGSNGTGAGAVAGTGGQQSPQGEMEW